MKISNLIIVTLLLTGSVAVAQKNTERNDHTYSTHNYKHPNKAAEARQWEQKGAVTVTPPAELPALANYKQPVPGSSSAGGVTINTTGPASVASRNYKAGNSQMQPTGYNYTRSANRKRSGIESTTSIVGNE